MFLAVLEIWNSDTGGVWHICMADCHTHARKPSTHVAERGIENARATAGGHNNKNEKHIDSNVNMNMTMRRFFRACYVHFLLSFLFFCLFVCCDSCHAGFPRFRKTIESQCRFHRIRVRIAKSFHRCSMLVAIRDEEILTQNIFWTRLVPHSGMCAVWRIIKKKLS